MTTTATDHSVMVIGHKDLLDILDTTFSPPPKESTDLKNTEAAITMQLNLTFFPLLDLLLYCSLENMDALHPCHADVFINRGQ